MAVEPLPLAFAGGGRLSTLSSNRASSEPLSSAGGEPARLVRAALASWIEGVLAWAAGGGGVEPGCRPPLRERTASPSPKLSIAMSTLAGGCSSEEPVSGVGGGAVEAERTASPSPKLSMSISRVSVGLGAGAEGRGRARAPLGRGRGVAVVRRGGGSPTGFESELDWLSDRRGGGPAGWLLRGAGGFGRALVLPTRAAAFRGFLTDSTAEPAGLAVFSGPVLVFPLFCRELLTLGSDGKLARALVPGLGVADACACFTGPFSSRFAISASMASSCASSAWLGASNSASSSHSASMVWYRSLGSSAMALAMRSASLSGTSSDASSARLAPFRRLRAIAP